MLYEATQQSLRVRRFIVNYTECFKDGRSDQPEDSETIHDPVVTHAVKKNPLISSLKRGNASWDGSGSNLWCITQTPT